MNYKKCYNFQDFRSLAKSKLPSPIFNYIDGAADDEVTYRRNTSSFDDVSLIPSVLRGVKNVIILKISELLLNLSFLHLYLII